MSYGCYWVRGFIKYSLYYVIRGHQLKGVYLDFGPEHGEEAEYDYIHCFGNAWYSEVRFRQANIGQRCNAILLVPRPRLYRNPGF